MSEKSEVEDFVGKCKKLEGLFVKKGILSDVSSDSYLSLIENIANNNLDSSINVIETFEEVESIEMDIFFTTFFECMYEALIENETPLTSTNYVQFKTMQEMENGFFRYANYKAMINYSVKKDDFNNIINRIPIILGVSYYIVANK
jgi:hypothetical protein